MKKGKMIAAAGAIYFIAALGIYCTNLNSNNIVNNVEQDNPEISGSANLPDNQPVAADIDIKSDILSQHSLPSLERMDREDQEQYVNPLQVIKRMEMLGLSTNDMLCPEISIAKIEEIVGILDDRYYAQGETITFDGTTSQELQQVINEHPYVVVDIVSEQIEVTEPIVLHGNTTINGNGVRLHTEGVEHGFFVQSADNICISNIVINGEMKNGIYCIDCSHVKLASNVIKGCSERAVSIVGTSDGLVISNNKISDNQSGAVYIAGNASNGLIESNTITDNHGNSGLMAGIVMTNAMPTECPHNFIIRNNKIEDNGSAGIYSDGAYMSYILNNIVCGNDKEGMSLCHGTLGFYVSKNTFRFNGQRLNKTDDELKTDFVLDAGRMEDGSSKAKLPGVLLDNAAYNILENNNLTENYGGGINMPHTAVRNVVMGNVIRDNNVGQNDVFSYYGIALETEPLGMENTEVDFTADYENIICRNIISGNHYSGIFLDEGCYINDIFDNIIMDAQVCGIEAVSLKFNSIINNITNCGVTNAFQ